MEPIMKLEVVTPEENMGDVIGDLNKRRGQVEGMESSRSGARIVKAMVPLAEMFGYVTALRTITFWSCNLFNGIFSPCPGFQLYCQGSIGGSEKAVLT